MITYHLLHIGPKFQSYVVRYDDRTKDILGVASVQYDFDDDPAQLTFDNDPVLINLLLNTTAIEKRRLTDDELDPDCWRGTSGHQTALFGALLGVGIETEEPFPDEMVAMSGCFLCFLELLHQRIEGPYGDRYLSILRGFSDVVDPMIREAPDSAGVLIEICPRGHD